MTVANPPKANCSVSALTIEQGRDRLLHAAADFRVFFTVGQRCNLVRIKQWHGAADSLLGASIRIPVETVIQRGRIHRDGRERDLHVF